MRSTIESDRHSEVQAPAVPGVAAVNARALLLERQITLASVLIPYFGLLGAIALLWGTGLHMIDLELLAAMDIVTVIGIGVGFHRLITHRAFQTGPVVKGLLVIFGSMAVQGPILFWAAVHRRHHRYSDRPGDPHSPHLYGKSFGALLRGLWHAHTGWLFEYQVTDWGTYVPDLLRDRLIFRLHRLYLLWVMAGLVLPAALGGWIAGTWMGFVHGFLWGGLVRVLLVHHTTWSINSICHVFGSRPYPVHDHSANNFLLAIPSFGESWHNNHHAFPRSAMHGLKWWQIDLHGYLIHVLQLIGLAWDVRTPVAEGPRH